MVRKIRVCTLVGDLELEVKRSTDGGEVVDLICSRIGLSGEELYFGASYPSKEARIKWARRGKKLPATPVLSFRVRHFPQDIGQVRSDAAVKLMYRQVKDDILSGQLYASSEVVLLLCSYQLQAEHGDTILTPYPSLLLEQLVPKTARYEVGRGKEVWVELVRGWQEGHRGMSRVQAMREYLQVAQGLPGFGLHRLPVTWETRPAWLGIAPSDLRIYSSSNVQAPKVMLAWVLIKGIRYSGKKFKIKTIFPKLPEYEVRARDSSSAKEAFRLCIGCHKVYLQRLARESCRKETGTTEDRRGVEEERKVDVDEVVSKDEGISKDEGEARKTEDEGTMSRYQFRSESFCMVSLPTLPEEDPLAVKPSTNSNLPSVANLSDSILF